MPTSSVNESFSSGPSPSKETVRDLEVTTAVRLGRTIASIAKEINAESVGIAMFPGTKSAGITQLLLGTICDLYAYV